MSSTAVAAPLPDPAAVQAMRQQLYAGGFRPIPLYTHTHRIKDAGKRPLGEGWQLDARRDPPICVDALAVVHALNTGILCDGLRGLDIDLDDPDLVAEVIDLARQLLGATLERYRADSPRAALVYQAAEGEPGKLRIVRPDGGKIEVLGRGQQLAALGYHPAAGAELRWRPKPLTQARREELPKVTEPQLMRFLTEAAELIGAPAPRGLEPQQEHVTGQLQASAAAVATALATIPNNGPRDWEHWNRIGMAVYGAADGAAWGLHAWHAWSAKSPHYDAQATERRWLNYIASPPTSLGAGTVFHLAHASTPLVRVEVPPEPVDEEPGYWQALDAQAGLQTATAQPVVDEQPLAEGAATSTRPVLEVLTPSQIGPEQARPYVVKGLMAHGDHVVLMGQPGGGKSALAPAIAYSVTQGRSVFGRRVKAGPVIYLACEDGAGMKNRVRALRQRHGEAETFHLVTTPVNLLADADDQTLKALEDLVKRVQPVLIVVDTLHKAFPGLRENEGEDMGRLVHAIRRLSRLNDSLSQLSDACMLSIHHVAKDAGVTPRGHGSLAADADLTMLITGEKAETRTITLGKNRNGPSDATFNFAIEADELGLDEDGDTITAPVAVDAERPDPKAARAAKLVPRQALLLRTIQSLDPRVLQELRPKPDMPVCQVVSREVLRSVLIQQGWLEEDLLCEAGPPAKLSRKGYTVEQNNLISLMEKHFIGFDRQWVWLA